MSLLLSAARAALSLLPDPVPARQRRLAGRRARVDGIDFTLPVDSRDTPALVAAFTCDARAAAALLPGGEVHPLRLLRGRSLFVVTVVDYTSTDIGRYVEHSLAVACTHGPDPAPPLLPGLLQGTYGTGQYVLDLPVSSEVSVHGGKGIWGMPKHQANLDFLVTPTTVSSQYDVDGLLACRIAI
ncbi:MAG: acetoacetate decarboxylase, partial [Frankiales bacterium]|nr:acetoacetate decarboxylase [Frankiales bacterium]